MEMWWNEHLQSLIFVLELGFAYGQKCLLWRGFNFSKP